MRKWGPDPCLAGLHDAVVPSTIASRREYRAAGGVQHTVSKEAGCRVNAWVVIVLGFVVGFACLAYVFTQ